MLVVGMLRVEGEERDLVPAGELFEDIVAADLAAHVGGKQASAIMAALSVHIARLGRYDIIPRAAKALAKRARSDELAATPPARQAPCAPISGAAATDFATRPPPTDSVAE